MTIDEASERYQIPIEVLKEYESWGLCGAVRKDLSRRKWRNICVWRWKAIKVGMSGCGCWINGGERRWMRSI